jgi:hypothetical protein
VNHTDVLTILHESAHRTKGGRESTAGTTAVRGSGADVSGTTGAACARPGAYNHTSRSSVSLVLYIFSHGPAFTDYLPLYQPRSHHGSHPIGLCRVCREDEVSPVAEHRGTTARRRCITISVCACQTPLPESILRKRRLTDLATRQRIGSNAVSAGVKLWTTCLCPRSAGRLSVQEPGLWCAA